MVVVAGGGGGGGSGGAGGGGGDQKPVAEAAGGQVGCCTWRKRTSCTPHWRVRLVSAPDELMRHRHAFFRNLRERDN